MQRRRWLRAETTRATVAVSVTVPAPSKTSGPSACLARSNELSASGWPIVISMTVIPPSASARHRSTARDWSLSRRMATTLLATICSSTAVRGPIGTGEPGRSVLLVIATSSVEARPQDEPRLPGRQGGGGQNGRAHGNSRETGVRTSVSET